ncbi:glycoside hydrolase family 3 N-terminal domain-containing protein [Hamadaea tsunoensis]|uniref:glycoside hydrolase family 3 N-terminal domain-containing protein n=1 Tax=Hamadaea tsunoensis TaxID=53368 RepID=UPI0012F7ACDA|nr:glycoside hydrolase family 3 N-terminal domain-containing protein [Hamadaea tsunoensis]
MPRRRTVPAAAVLGLVAAVLIAPARGDAHLPYPDPSLPVATRVSQLLASMTLDEKVGQMTQAERASVSNADITNYALGSILSGGGSAPSPNTASSWADMYDGFQNAALNSRLGIPIIYGVDAVHGHNNVYGATIFPHNIGLGATRDPALVQQIGRATAEEVSGTGIDWDFSPCLCVARNDRWGRTYESFGEKPEIPSSMTTYITGLQGTTLGGAASVLATAKHYIGDGGTTNGTDQGNTQISEADLRAIHLPPFQAAVQKGVGSIMISYSSWNGVKDHGNQYLITTLLKGELGFSGFVVSDWNGIDQIDGQAGFTAAEVTQSINAGIDMVMVPTAWQQFITTLKAEVNNGHIAMSRINDAVSRILTKKFELGLFEKPLTDRTYTPTVGNAAHRAIARQAVRESQVLLKNSGNVLPLAKSGGKIFVAGKNADNIGNQSGGWTISWQGGSGPTTQGTSILQGIRTTVGSGATVTYNANGTGIDSSYRAAIAVVGETPYAEGAGDRPSGMGLDSTDLATLNTLKASGVPVVVVLVSGRPLDIGAQLPNWNALIESWLPGTEGQGVADVLFGDYAPTGKLPDTWMQSASQQPINDGDGQTPLFAYGFGLSYGTQPAADAYAQRQAESYATQSGTQLETTTDTGGGQDVGYITAGDWLNYGPVDFGSSAAASVTTRLASGASVTGTVQYRLDSTTGPIVASVPVSSTGGWQNWTSATTALTGSATGVHSLYATFTTSGSGDLLNLNWFQFNHAGTPNAYQQRQAEGYSSQSGTQLETTTDTGGGQDVGYITAGDWLAYSGVDFGSTAGTSVTTRLASGASVTGTVQYRLDSATGPVIASVPVSSTGGWQNWTSATTTLTGSATGTHTVYVTFTTSGAGDLVNLNWFTFNQ